MNTAIDNWRRAVVVGLGKTGYSVAQHLRARGVDVRIEP